MSSWWWLLLGALAFGPLWVLAALWLARRTFGVARRMTSRARGRNHLAELGQLAGGLAHEIKNPLSTINVNLKLLAEDLASPACDHARSLRRLEAVRNETARLKDILDDFLRYAGRMELSCETVDLRRLVGELSDFFAPQAQASRVVIRTAAPESPVRANVDANLVKQALLNLMLNALQAMSPQNDAAAEEPHGGELLVKVSNSHGQALIEVIDTGLGIAGEDLPRLFQVYYTTKSCGMGLGLATTMRIVREHGGAIHVQSEVGKGTRFVISLPLAK